MSSRDVLSINTETLAAVAAKARSTATASVPGAVTPPPPTAISNFDAACVAVADGIANLLQQVSAKDLVAADKQATMLAVSPPAIVEQDTEAADTYVAPVVPLRQFPMPTVRQGSDATQIWTT